MKKIVWTALVLFLTANINGCAIPEKTRVSSPPSPSSEQVPAANGPESPLPGSSDMVMQPELVEKNLKETEPSASYLNDRVYEYGQKLDRWQELDRQSLTRKVSEEDSAQMLSCFHDLQDILNGYNDLRTKIRQPQVADTSPSANSEEFIQLQKTDIAFLEGKCGRLLAAPAEKSVAWTPPTEGADLSQFETMIDTYAANRDYDAVTQIWAKIPASQSSQVHLRTRILYAEALRYLHQEEKAADVYQQVVDQMAHSTDQPTDLLSLRKVLADLYTVSGDYRLATDQYKKISDDYDHLGQLEEWSKMQLAMLARSGEGSPELLEFSGILRDYLGYVPERDGYRLLARTKAFAANYPYSPVTANVDLINDAVREQADAWFNGVIAQVDQLGKENNYPKAISILENLPDELVGPEKQPVVKAKIEELQTAEAVAQEAGQMAKIQDLQNQWNNGLLLANGGRYDEAIAAFTTLLNTEYSSKAKEKIDELSLEAAKADRKKAADYFIRFTRTDDLESKKKLLVESRRLLKNILLKYPKVEIAGKVQGNIARVEQEMNALDPNLVYMADLEDQSAVKKPDFNGAASVPESSALKNTASEPVVMPRSNPGIAPPAN